MCAIQNLNISIWVPSILVKSPKDHLLNETTYILKNRLHQQSFLNRHFFLNWDSFLNRSFLNRDFTVFNLLNQETKKDWTATKLTPCKSLKAKSGVIVKLLLLKKTKDIFDVGCLEINRSPPPKYVSV